MADTPIQDRKNGLSRENQGGRFVTKYEPMLALKACERIAEGETLKSICEGSAEFPSRQTFHRWVVNNPDLGHAYKAARELSAFSMEEEALDLARELGSKKVPKDQIRALDVAMSQLRWSASKRNARVFSERAAMQFTVPIQINTSLDLGGSASDVAPDHPNVYALDAVVTVEDPPDEVKAPDEPFVKSDSAITKQKRKDKPVRKPRKRGVYG